MLTTSLINNLNIVTTNIPPVTDNVTPEQNIVTIVTPKFVTNNITEPINLSNTNVTLMQQEELITELTTEFDEENFLSNNTQQDLSNVTEVTNKKIFLLNGTETILDDDVIDGEGDEDGVVLSRKAQEVEALQCMMTSSNFSSCCLHTYCTLFCLTSLSLTLYIVL